VFVGWDWGNTTHDMTIIDAHGALLHREVIPHTEAGMTEAIKRLAQFGAPKELPVAIETDRGLVVDRLTEAGHPILPVHPNAFHAARPRWGAARAKTDPGDSFKLADYARTDGHRLSHPQQVNPQTLELQALTRARGDQVGLRVAAVNQLAALLDTYWPGGKAVFATLHSAIALNFLNRYPSPQSAAKLTAAKMAAFCTKYGYSGRRTAEELLERMRGAPVAATSVNHDVIGAIVTAQVAVVKAMQTAISDLDAVIAEKVARHPYAHLLAHLPRIGVLNLGQIIGEVGPLLERATSFDQLAAQTGIAPVTRASGKSHVVSFRYATNRRARQALHTWCDNSRHGAPWARQRYSDARARGQRHAHALRTLGRAWLRIIWACWQAQTPYDPELHKARNEPTEA
jgi:transposase